MLFKLLGENGEAFQGGHGHWPLPTQQEDGSWKPGNWLKVYGPLEICLNGLHLCSAEYITKWSSPSLYIAEYAKDAEVINGGDKLCGNKARLLRLVETWNNRTLRIFATRCARRAWHLLRGDDEKEAVNIARKYADGEATFSEFRDAGEAIAVHASGPSDIAWDTTRYEAWNAVWAVAENSAWNLAALNHVRGIDTYIERAEKHWQTKHLLWMLGLREKG